MAKRHREEDGEEKKEEKEREARASKISTPEIVFFTLLCGSADILEIVAFMAVALPVIGWAAWAFAAFVGLIVSAIVIVWSFMRGWHGKLAARKATVRGLINIAGWLFDIGTLAWLPIRTLAFLLSVFINNYLMPFLDKRRAEHANQ